MIKLTGINKHYGSHHVLRHINLTIGAGEIFGVIGKSGAGKSTLLRSMNLLERPDAGSINIDGRDLMTLTPHELREARHPIGMIFQHFNLLNAKSVYENIAFPLRIQGVTESAIQSRVTELLDVVELKDKAKSFPAALSGGQKQRVAIARALASSPQVLLCDEATSALDPETTTSILALLKKINRDYGITIVLITHEMDVIKQLAHRVALMHNGKITDIIALNELFSAPQSPAKQQLCAQLSPEIPPCLLNNLSKKPKKTGPQKPLLRLFFQGTAVNGPFISQISRDMHLDINILIATIDRIDGVTCGVLIVELHAEAKQLQDFITCCQELNLIVETLGYVHDPAL